MTRKSLALLLKKRPVEVKSILNSLGWQITSEKGTDFLNKVYNQYLLLPTHYGLNKDSEILNVSQPTLRKALRLNNHKLEVTARRKFNHEDIIKRYKELPAHGTLKYDSKVLGVPYAAFYAILKRNNVEVIPKTINTTTLENLDSSQKAANLYKELVSKEMKKIKELKWQK